MTHEYAVNVSRFAPGGVKISERYSPRVQAASPLYALGELPALNEGEVLVITVVDNGVVNQPAVS